MTMQYPFVLPCPICGETPKTYEYPQDGKLKAICPNCGFDFNEEDCDEPATVWNYGVKRWFEEGIPYKQCPKCRAKDEEYEYITLEHGPNGYYVMCQQCQHAGPFAATIPAALITWNKQQEPESVTTQDKEARLMPTYHVTIYPYPLKDTEYHIEADSIEEAKKEAADKFQEDFAVWTAFQIKAELADE